MPCPVIYNIHAQSIKQSINVFASNVKNRMTRDEQFIFRERERERKVSLKRYGEGTKVAKKDLVFPRKDWSAAIFEMAGPTTYADPGKGCKRRDANRIQKEWRPRVMLTLSSRRHGLGGPIPLHLLTLQPFPGPTPFLAQRPSTS